MMEIERNPTAPRLNKKAIDLITQLCFRKDDQIQKVDGIFLFSTAFRVKELARLVENLLLANVSKKVFITGGFSPLVVSLGLNRTEADLVLDEIDRERFRDVDFFIERKSTNTLENVTETLKIPEFSQCERILFVFKSHAAGRGYLTLKKFFPQAKIFQKTLPGKYPGVEKEITRDNWHTFSFGRSRVWGEFLRIKTYGSRGDIEYDSVRDLVARIEREVA